jgi:hypothetical protein
VNHTRVIAPILTSLLLEGEVERVLLDTRGDGEQVGHGQALQPAPSPLLLHDEPQSVEQVLRATAVATARPRERQFGFYGSDGVGFGQGPFNS